MTGVPIENKKYTFYLKLNNHDKSNSLPGRWF